MNKMKIDRSYFEWLLVDLLAHACPNVRDSESNMCLFAIDLHCATAYIVATLIDAAPINYDIHYFECVNEDFDLHSDAYAHAKRVFKNLGGKNF